MRTPALGVSVAPGWLNIALFQRKSMKGCSWSYRCGPPDPSASPVTGTKPLWPGGWMLSARTTPARAPMGAISSAISATRTVRTHPRTIASSLAGMGGLRFTPMRFGIFYEHQLPRPWEDDGGERKLIADALEQIELADR